MYAPTEQSPTAQIIDMMDGCLIAQLIHVAAELGLADLVEDGPRSVEELGAATGNDAEALYRALRALASKGVFTETAPRTFGLTSLAATLRTRAPDSLRKLATIRGSRSHWRSWTELRHSLRTGQSVFRQLYGTDFWTYLASEPDEAALFNSAMGDEAERLHTAAADAYGLTGARRLVDVGGGRGDLAVTFLERYPELTAVVFDRPQVIAEAEDRLSGSSVRDRVELVAGDFFTSVPKGGDVYMLSRILHDWDDANSSAILANVSKAIAPEAKVMVVDAVVPDGDAPHPAKVMDIIMLALHGGRERTEAEFARLFATAGLRHTTTRHTALPISVVIAEAEIDGQR
ncbi:methyltransferase [Streptomyces sp. NPDC057499]|uniref:methyltransferase n=1 Tax=Streptomyces sp. NPDC057499 TaxID=3346150 RepID=UPI0036AF897A